MLTLTLMLDDVVCARDDVRRSLLKLVGRSLDSSSCQFVPLDDDDDGAGTAPSNYPVSDHPSMLPANRPAAAAIRTEHCPRAAH
jgi:hypothetical protein